MATIPIKNKIIMVKKGSVVRVPENGGDVVEYELDEHLFVQVQYTEHVKAKMTKVIHQKNKPIPKPKLVLLKPNNT